LNKFQRLSLPEFYFPKVLNLYLVSVSYFLESPNASLPSLSIPRLIFSSLTSNLTLNGSGFQFDPLQSTLQHFAFPPKQFQLTYTRRHPHLAPQQQATPSTPKPISLHSERYLVPPTPGPQNASAPSQTSYALFFTRILAVPFTPAQKLLRLKAIWIWKLALVVVSRPYITLHPRALGDMISIPCIVTCRHLGRAADSSDEAPAKHFFDEGAEKG
jgi:hypothetical protein